MKINTKARTQCGNFKRFRETSRFYIEIRSKVIPRNAAKIGQKSRFLTLSIFQFFREINCEHKGSYKYLLKIFLREINHRIRKLESLTLGEIDYYVKLSFFHTVSNDQFFRESN